MSWIFLVTVHGEWIHIIRRLHVQWLYRNVLISLLVGEVAQVVTPLEVGMYDPPALTRASGCRM